MSSAATIAEALACGRPGCPCAATARRGSGLTHCPAHADDKPSLSVSQKDGKVLVHCQAGCLQEAVIAALRERELWPEAKRRSNKRIVATYPYVDEAGLLLFEAVRYEPKDFRQRRPDGNGGFVDNIDGVRRVLYRLPELLAADPTELVFIPEGEKHVDRLRSLGFIATTNAGGAEGWRSEYADTLAGRRLAILPDNDEPGRNHERNIIASVHGIAAEVRVVTLPGLPEKGDVLDWLDAGGTAEKLRELAEAAPLWEPAPVPDGATLLDELTVLVRKYVVLTADQAAATALWVLHSHAIDAADATPYLHIASAEKRSGKTRLLEVIDLIAARPWLVGRVTAAVLIRKTERDHPTVLLDESDSTFKKESEYSEALRGLLDAGHRRGVVASLCIGKNHDIGDFNLFGPKAIAGIGALPDTIADRAIRIVLRRRAPSERVARFYRREAASEAEPLRAAAEAWATANIEALRAARPDLPTYLDDRALDGWEPLLAIADAAGEGWARRARMVALAISNVDIRADESAGVRLLADIRELFDDRGVDRLPTADLLSALNALDESPWGDWSGKPLTPRGVAKLLRPYGIKPGTIRLTDGQTPKGYVAGDFADAWGRYLPSPGNPPQAPQAPQAPHSDSADVANVADVAANTGTQEHPSPLVQAALDMGATPIDAALRRA